MTIQGINFIKKYEGCRLKAYKPVATEKHYTIGYGHYGSDVKADMVISQEEADRLLVENIKTIEYQLRLFMPATLQNNLKKHQWDMIVSFCFNLGVANFHKSTLYKKMCANLNDYDAIGKEWLKWCNAGGKRLEGLVRRRKEELEIFINGYKN